MVRVSPLRIVYNITSNKPPRYRDDPDAESITGSETPPNGRLDARYHTDADELPLIQTGHYLGGDDEEARLPSRRIYRPFWKAWRAVVRWVQGPMPPRPWSIKPFFPNIQTAPLALMDRFFPRMIHRFFLLLVFYFFWILAFVLILKASASSEDIAGYGPPSKLTCLDTFWTMKNGCGINGNACRPFSNQSMAIRCPASCLRTQLLNPRAVGDQDVSYRPFVVGGPRDASGSIDSAIYRADSFICSSAIHAGFFADADGGCGVLELVGEQVGFPNVTQNKITSIGFDSYFPRSFKFVESTRTHCKDLRWYLLAVSVVFSSLLSIFTTSPSVFFFSTFIGLYFQIGLASDPPNLVDYYELVSVALARLLPSCFVMFVVFQYCVKRTLTGLTAQFEKTILWLGGCWISSLNNSTFKRIPLERLTPHDVKNQPGAIPALIIVVLTVFFIAVGQAWAIRIEGKMPQYLALYGFMGACILAMIPIPHMHLRIHHYILGLLLVPGTAMQNRPSLLYQGLLVGFFINGIARWGYDSILQTPNALLGDGQLGTALPYFAAVAPSIVANSITFSWTAQARNDTYWPDDADGISILVNDVERFRGYRDYGATTFTWKRHGIHETPDGGHGDDGATEKTLKEYFRFAYMSGAQVGDYTKAGTWQVDGTWTDVPVDALSVGADMSAGRSSAGDHSSNPPSFIDHAAPVDDDKGGNVDESASSGQKHLGQS